MGGSKAWKPWSLKSGGLEPSSLIEVCAYARVPVSITLLLILQPSRHCDRYLNLHIVGLWLCESKALVTTSVIHCAQTKSMIYTSQIITAAYYCKILDWKSKMQNAVTRQHYLVHFILEILKGVVALGQSLLKLVVLLLVHCNLTQYTVRCTGTYRTV